MQIIFLKRKSLIIILFLFFLILAGMSVTFSLPNRVFKHTQLHKRVVIDAGHGSIDAGCSYNDLLEKEINLQVAFLLKELLEEANIEVVMTRTEDVLYNRSRHDDIIYRARLTKEVKADAFISIHVNKYPTSEPFGGQAYYYGGEDSKQLAQLIQEQLKLIQPENYRSIGRGNYYVLKKAPCPATIVEIGFISNAMDRKRMTEPVEQLRIATAIRNGLIAYFYSQFEKSDLEEETYTPRTYKMDNISSSNNIYFAGFDNYGDVLIPVHKVYSPEESISADTAKNLTFLETIAVRAISHLLRGPEEADLISVIPPGTELKALSIHQDLVTLNFNKNLRENHWGGAESEKATLESIVKTLTSIPGIERVRILIEGESAQTIAGHIYLDDPLSYDMF